MPKLFLSLFVLLLVAAAGGSSFVDAQSGGGRPAGEVVVVNDAATPVPTQAVGTTAVSGAVDVSGAVAVSGAVTVANGDDAAVPVRVVNAPAQPTPVFFSTQILIGPGDEGESEQLMSVPAHQRLVIETFTVEAHAPTGQTVYQFRVLGAAGTSGGHFQFELAPAHKTVAAFDRFVTAQQTRIPVRGGAGLIVFAFRDSDVGTALVNVTLSGFLVDQ